MDELYRLKKLAGIFDKNDNDVSEDGGSNISIQGSKRGAYMRKHDIQPGTDEWFKLWFAKPKLTGENPMPKVTETRSKEHLRKKQKAQAYAKQHYRDPEDFPHDSPEHYIQQAAYNKRTAHEVPDRIADKKLIAKATTATDAKKADYIEYLKYFQDKRKKK